MIEDRRLLAGRYRLEEPVGHGGMAQVYRATDQVLNRTVAVKVMAPHLTRDPTFVRRFEREAQSAAGLSHPGVVAVFDTGVDDDLHFIVMEFVQGQTLAELLREGPLPPDQALGIAGDVASALAAAHATGLIHRDVKPGNIMVTPAGAAKAMDFGIARAIATDTVTQTSSLLGTAAYLSPEQAAGEPLDARSDLYSLGVVLYEMLTGRPPFIAESPVAVAYMHISQKPDPPSRAYPALGPQTDAVVMRALAKAPSDRYATAEELQADLQALATGRAPPPAMPTTTTAPIVVEPTAVLPAEAGVLSRPPPRGPRRTRTTTGRRRAWTALVVLIAVLAAITVAVAVGLLGGEPGKLAVVPSTTLPPATVSSPPPTTAALLSVDKAVSALEGLVADGRDSGAITPPAANDIEHGVADALKEFEKGDLDKALEMLSELQDKMAELVDKGEIDSSVAGQLDQAIDDLAAAMQAEAPSGEEGD